MEIKSQVRPGDFKFTRLDCVYKRKTVHKADASNWIISTMTVFYFHKYGKALQNESFNCTFLSLWRRTELHKGMFFGGFLVQTL